MLKNGFKLLFKKYSKIGLITTGLYLFHTLQNKKSQCYNKPSLVNIFYGNYLLEFKPEAFVKKRCPKILFLTDGTEEEAVQDKIRHSFEKIHKRYNELESYYYDLRGVKSIEELRGLFKQYGYSLDDFVSVDEETGRLNDILNELTKKPFFFLNKYGDIKNYTVREFRELSKAEAISTYFEKLTILTNKSDITLLNDNDYMFFIYRKANLDYGDDVFRIFRKIYFNLNFFNIKFFVATPENTPFLADYLEENNIYLLKRDNMLGSTGSSLKFENEDFELFNLTKDMEGLSKASDGNLF
jgi:hypothetical protein